MNAVVVILDFLTAWAIVAALLAAAALRAQRSGAAAKVLLMVTLGLYAFVAGSNILEHTGVTAFFDPYEDYAEILFFPFALFFVYAIWARRELGLRCEVEGSLAESRRTLATLMSNLPGMAYRCVNDRQWTMEFVSDGCRKLTGYEPEDLIGNAKVSYDDLIHPKDRQQVWKQVQDALAASRSFMLQYRINTAVGDTKWVWEQGVGVPSGEEGQLRLEGFISDITELKRAERDLALYRRHLESLVRARTAELRKTQAELQTSLTRLEEDEEAGRLIQFKLLPDERMVFDGYQFSRRVIPSMYLSGDFVDFFRIDEEHCGFYMADVSGHGVSSAFVTVFLKSFLVNSLANFKAGRDSRILEPAKLLGRLNAEFISEDLEKHVTMFYGVISASDNVLRYANAGHFPFPLIWTREGSSSIEDKALPVGLFDFASYETVERKLPGEFALVLFSDGILDALPPGTISEKLAYLKGLPCGQACEIDSLIKSIGLDRETSFPDDITFMIVKRGGEGHE